MSRRRVPAPSRAPREPVPPPRPPGRAVALIVGGLLTGVLALLMIEQSARWLLTAAARGSFVSDQFQVDHLRDRPGKGGFAYDGHVVSTGELIHTSATIVVSLYKLRELEAAGAIPGARVPVWYLPASSSWAAFDGVFRFRVQAPDAFELNAAGWVVFNLLAAAGGVWLIRRGVRLVRSSQLLAGDPVAGTARTMKRFGAEPE